MSVSGLFYDAIGNDIGVEMALGEANKLNYAAAAAAVVAVKDEEEARLKAQQDEQNRAQQEDAAAAAAGTVTSPTEGEPQDTATSPDEAAKGVCVTVFSEAKSAKLGALESGLQWVM